MKHCSRRKADSMFCELWEPNRDEDSAQRDSKVVLDESTNLIELVSEKGKLASNLTTLYILSYYCFAWIDLFSRFVCFVFSEKFMFMFLNIQSYSRVCARVILPWDLHWENKTCKLKRVWVTPGKRGYKNITLVYKYVTQFISLYFMS